MTKSKNQAKKTVCLQSLPMIHPNAAGIDVGAKEHVVAVPADRDPEPVRSFKAFTPDLYELADWLKGCGVETVALESTGIYWITLYEILEERGFQVRVVNAGMSRTCLVAPRATCSIASGFRNSTVSVCSADHSVPISRFARFAA